jgi:subtilisin family serine protease
VQHLLKLAVAGAALLTLASGRPAPAAPGPAVIPYDAVRYPQIEVVAGRVIAETDARLSAAQRAALWRQYGLEPQLEWVRGAAAADPGFTYHELRVRGWTPLDRARHAAALLSARVLGRPAPAPLPARELPRLVAALNEDPRVHWVSPDALILQWMDGGGKDTPGVPATQPARPGAPGWEAATPGSEPAAPETAPAEPAEATAPAPAAEGPGPLLTGKYSVGFVNSKYNAILSVREWEQAVYDAAVASTPEKPVEVAGPMPEFEYYRLATPEGNPVEWAPELQVNAKFMQRCGTIYGTAQAQALAAYQAAGHPGLSPVTVCIADTGVFINHPDFAGRLHPNALDCNYSTYRIAAAGERAQPLDEITNREAANAVGLPRPALRGKPASHGTCVAGEVVRCTAGFLADGEAPAVRLLPASVRSDRAVTFVSGRIKTPISSFIRLVYALNREFPTGTQTPDPRAQVQNSGDVRVVSVSASVPKSYFSDAEWRLVANLAGKAAGAIAEDLRTNDRLYVFAAGNEAQAEPNKPGDVDYVLGVSAARPFSASQAWFEPQFKEGSNMGANCVSAPGEGLITSTLYKCPNLKYLADDQFRPRANWSTPRTGRDWVQETNEFGATSGATPQVSALAALLYAQQPDRKYGDVLKLVRDSTGGRSLLAPYGKSLGLVDYRSALGWR